MYIALCKLNILFFDIKLLINNPQLVHNEILIKTALLWIMWKYYCGLRMISHNNVDNFVDYVNNM